MFLKNIEKSLRVALFSGLALGLSGCGGFDGVDLNGKIFDAMGMNTGSVQQEEVKLPPRQGLVVPPSAVALPEPGSVMPPQTDLAEIKDHDRSKIVSQEELERQQVAYCEKNYDEQRAMADPTIDMVSGPLGPCRKSILSKVNIKSPFSSGN